MTRLRGMTLAAALMTGLTIPAVSLAGPASAAAGNGPWQGPFTYGPQSEVQENFCDVPGLTVDLALSSVEQFRYTSPGVADLPYLWYFHVTTEVYTNVETGESVTNHIEGSSKTVRVTDNRDGTLTLDVTNRSQQVLSSDDGDVIARSAGLFSYSVVYDYAGTPTDPSDDFKFGRPFNFKDKASTATSARPWSARSASREFTKRSGEPALEHPLRAAHT